jgi:hypothetical protein
MKTIAAFLCVAFAASVAQAQPSPGVNKADSNPALEKPAETKPGVAKQTDPKVVVAKTTDPKAATVKKEVKKEELPKIPGTEIPRPNGTFLGLEVVGGNFKLTFYDKKKKPMTVDVTRATARWPNPRSPGDNRTVLNGSGTALVGQKPVLPPFNFNVFLTLLKGEGEEAKAVENYTVAFRG